LKIYNQGLKIYFHGLKIYYQSMKIVLLRAFRAFYLRGKELFSHEGRNFLPQFCVYIGEKTVYLHGNQYKTQTPKTL